MGKEIKLVATLYTPVAFIKPKERCFPVLCICFSLRPSKLHCDSLNSVLINNANKVGISKEELIQRSQVADSVENILKTGLKGYGYGFQKKRVLNRTTKLFDPK